MPNKLSERHSASIIRVKDWLWKQGEAIRVQTWRDPKCSRRLRASHFKTIGTWRPYVCQPYAPAAFTPRRYVWYYFLLETEPIPGPWDGLSQRIIPMTPSGIEPATFWLVAQRLNLLNPSGCFTYRQVYHSKILHGARCALSVLYGYQNRQRLLLCTSLTDWFL